MNEQKSNFLDAKENFINLFRKATKCHYKQRIKIDEYNNINEAIKRARDVLNALKATEDKGFIEDQAYLMNRDLETLIMLKEHYEKEDRIKHKPRCSIDKEGMASLDDFYDKMEFFNENYYSKAIILGYQDEISLTEFTNLTVYLEVGNRILDEANNMLLEAFTPEYLIEESHFTKNTSFDYISAEFQGSRTLLSSVVEKVKNIREEFLHNPSKHICLDDEWINYH